MTTPQTPADAMPSDEEILAALVRRQEEINRAWDGAEETAQELIAAMGQTAATISFRTNDGNSTYYDHEEFGWTDLEGVSHTLQWGDVEGQDEQWETLGACLDDLAYVTPPQPGEPVTRASVQFDDMTLALLVYAEEDEEGCYDMDASPIYQRFEEIMFARYEAARRDAQ